MSSVVELGRHYFKYGGNILQLILTENKTKMSKTKKHIFTLKTTYSASSWLLLVRQPRLLGCQVLNLEVLYSNSVVATN
jgi:hypothetical protein